MSEVVVGIKVYECCNGECGWKGEKKYCVTFKHGPEYLMCPECHETVEECLVSHKNNETKGMIDGMPV